MNSEALAELVSTLSNLQSPPPSLPSNARAVFSDGQKSAHTGAKRSATSPLQQMLDKKHRQYKSPSPHLNREPNPPVSVRGEQQNEPSTPVSDPDAQHFVRLFCAALQDITVQQLLGNIVRDQVETATQDHEDRIRSLEENNMMLNVQVGEMSKVVRSLEQKCDDLEQYGRRNAVRIRNPWPETQGEDTDQMIRTMCKDLLNIEIKPGEISRSHRVGRKGGNQPRPIIVKFSTYRTRENIVRNKKRLKEGGKEIQINEDLTYMRSSTAFRARQLKRREMIQDTWTQDGRVVIKDSNGRISSVVNDMELKTAFDPENEVFDFIPYIPRY